MNVPEIVKKLTNSINAADIICLAGVVLLAYWLLKTSLGKKALADSVPRRNNMPTYMPFIPLFIWFGAVSLAVSITRRLTPDLPGWQSDFLDNLILGIGGLITITVIFFLARATFARRLKGFGLNAKTIHKDFFAAVANLLSIWPPLLAMVILTTFFGKLIWGQQYQLQQHQELELITTYPQLPLRILIVVVAVVIAPVLEETLFRGLLQTMIRSFLAKPWLSILISSVLFTTVHTDAGHWPALFVLALCLGYAYEKSGSLLRPIFIHSLFNGVTIIAVLNQSVVK